MFRHFGLWWKFFLFAVVLIWYFIRLMVGYAIKGKDTRRGFRIRRYFCKAAIEIFNIRLTVIGDHQVKSGLYISNHRSMLDPMIELSLLDTYILSKAEVGDYPLIGKGAKETGVFFVDRDNDNSRKAALQSIEKLLREGKPVLIYAEGTTHAAEFTSDFRKGSFEVAAQHQIPVYPVMIEYPDASYYWTDGSLMDYFKRKFSDSRKHHVKVVISEPIQSADKLFLLNQTKARIDENIAAHKASLSNAQVVHVALKT